MHVKGRGRDKILDRLLFGCLFERLWKITKIPSQVNRFLFGELNPGPLEYEADLTTRPRCSSFFLVPKSFAIRCSRIFFDFIFGGCYIVACEANAGERAYNS